MNGLWKFWRFLAVSGINFDGVNTYIQLIFEMVLLLSNTGKNRIKKLSKIRNTDFRHNRFFFLW